MKLGTFTPRQDGGYSGKIATLCGIQADLVLLPVTDKTNDAAPDFRVMLSRTRSEVGAGWKRIAQDSGEAYVGVELDAPGFSHPIRAALFSGIDREHALIWTRR